VFRVPAYGDEWYPRRMYDPDDACNTHHIATYGEPSAWPYNNFIDGAYNKAGQDPRPRPSHP
jgi:alpha-L-fucosidase